MEGARSDLPEIALVGLARALVVGAALATIGVAVDLALLPHPTVRTVAAGTIFECLLGVLVAGPVAALERWARLRGRGTVELVAWTAVLAWLGAAAAFLQAIYAETTLTTGSPDDGLARLLAEARWLLQPFNSGGLCGSIAVTFAAAALARRLAPGDLRQQVLLGQAGPLLSAVVLILAVRRQGAGPGPVAMTLVMAAVVGLLLPVLSRAGDRVAKALGRTLGLGVEAWERPGPSPSRSWVLDRLRALWSALGPSEEAPDLLAFPLGLEVPTEAGDVLLTLGSVAHVSLPGRPIRYYAWYQNRRDRPTRLTVRFEPEGGSEVVLDVPVGGAEVGLAWRDAPIPGHPAARVLLYRVYARADPGEGERVRSRRGLPLPWDGDELPPVEHALGPEPGQALTPTPPSQGRWPVWSPGTSVELARERFLGAAAISHQCLLAPDLPEWLREDPSRQEPWQRWALALWALQAHSIERWEWFLQLDCPARTREEIKEWWGVTDTASARARLQSLAAGRHGSLFRTALDEARHLGPAAESHEDPAVRFAWARRDEIPPAQIRAWDVSRIVSLSMSCFNAAYLSEAEAWRWVRKAAVEAQTTFDSWRSWGESYALGYQFWIARGAQDPSPIEFPAALDRLLTDPRSPWVQVPWRREPV